MLQRGPTETPAPSSAPSATWAVGWMSTPLAVVGCGYEQKEAGYIVTGHVLAMFAPSFFTGHLIARFGVEKIVGTGIAGLTAAYLLNRRHEVTVFLGTIAIFVTIFGAAMWLRFSIHSLLFDLRGAEMRDGPHGVVGSGA